MPHVPGGDIAGEIVSLGPGADGAKLRPGARVLVDPSIPGRGMMGETARGGACEFVAVPLGHLLPIPDGVSYVDAAALPVAYGTAHRMLLTRGRLAAGETMLVLGASGGVGTCCVQLGKLVGARVIAATSSAAKAAKLAALGADEVIDTSASDWVEAMVARHGKPRTKGESGGVDVVVNFVGGEDWTRAYRVLKRGGRMLTCGATNGHAPAEDLRYVWSFEYEIIGSNGWTSEGLVALMAMVAAGRITPVIDSVRPLDRFLDSLLDLAERRVFGKAVLTP
jgi:alcohol dehydrogenase